MRHRSGINVITNAVNIGMELSNQAALNVTLTGGTMRWAGAFFADRACGDGDIERRVSLWTRSLSWRVRCGCAAAAPRPTVRPDEAAVFRAMVRQAKQVVVVADSSKIAMVSPALICPVADIDILITDSSIAPDALAGFKAGGIQVIAV